MTMRAALVGVALLVLATTLQAQSNSRVRVQTELGDIVLELDARWTISRKAP
jgi:hypothetical protein